MIDRDVPAALTAIQEALIALDVDVVLVPGKVAANLAGPLRQLANSERRNGARIPIEVERTIAAFEAARRRRDERAQVPHPEPDQVPHPEPPASSIAMEPTGYSTADAAARLGITPRAVRKAVSEGRLEATEFVGRYFIDPAAIDNYGS